MKYLAVYLLLFCLSASAFSDRLLFSVQGETYFLSDVQAIQNRLSKSGNLKVLKEIFAYRKTSLKSLSAESPPFFQIPFLLKLLSYLLSRQSEQKERFKTTEEMWESKLRKVELKLRSRFDLKLKGGKEIKRAQEAKRKQIMLNFIEMIDEKVVLDGH